MQGDSSSEEYLLTVSVEFRDIVNSSCWKLSAKMVANGHDSQFQLDSGATVNVLPTNERLLCQLDGLKQLLRKRLE